MNDREYLDALFSLVGYLDNEYEELLLLLDSIIFEYVKEIPLDVNLVIHAIYMRDLLGLEEGYRPESEATVLEVLVSLAYRMEHNILFNVDCGDRTALWFEMMMDNLNLFKYTDKYLLGVSDSWREQLRNEIKSKIIIFMHREYEADGTCGGLFPIEGIDVDLREVPLWQQMNLYLEANHIF